MNPPVLPIPWIGGGTTTKPTPLAAPRGDLAGFLDASYPSTRLNDVILPLHLEDALSKLNYTKPLKQVFGERFIDAFRGVKEEEMELYRKVISSWEREFLLLNV